MSYALNSFVNRNEAEALKEMIFRRVRERSESVSEDVQNDVMDMARESFVSKDNPFSKIVTDKGVETENSKTVHAEKTAEIGFPQRELKSRAVEHSRVLAEQISVKAIQDNMSEARAELSNKKSFMGALNFLNAQAAVSLMKTRADKFEMLV